MKLPAEDMQRWMHAVQDRPVNPLDLLSWVEGSVRAFFPFERVFLGYGRLVVGRISIEHCLASGHEERYLQELATSFDLSCRGSFQWRTQNRSPLWIDPACPPSHTSAFELEEMRTYGMRNVAAHGVLDPKSRAGSFFSFAGLPEGVTQPWTGAALLLIAPLLHERFTAYAAAAQPQTAPEKLLTARQREIAQWIAAGLSDKAVANKMAISDKTVRNQLNLIYEKLGVSSRTQLIFMFG